MQRLERPTPLIQDDTIDREVFQILADGSVPIEDISERIDASRSVIMTSVGRLVAIGRVEIVAVQYPWGVEFSLRRRNFESSVRIVRERAAWLKT